MKLAQKIEIPTFGSVDGPLPDDTPFEKLGDLISGGLDIAFAIATVLAFIWMVWGAFQYLFAGGDKDALSKARSRIISAIIGLLLIALAFAIAQFVEQILQPKDGAVRSPISFHIVNKAYAATPTPINVNLGTKYDFGYITNLGQALDLLKGPAFAIAATAVVIYFLIGGFKYLTSAGDKGAVQKARDMITHAIIGFLLLMLVFILIQYIPQVFGFKFRIFEP